MNPTNEDDCFSEEEEELPSSETPVKSNLAKKIKEHDFFEGEEEEEGDDGSSYAPTPVKPKKIKMIPPVTVGQPSRPDWLPENHPMLKLPHRLPVLVFGGDKDSVTLCFTKEEQDVVSLDSEGRPLPPTQFEPEVLSKIKEWLPGCKTERGTKTNEKDGEGSRLKRLGKITPKGAITVFYKNSEYLPSSNSFENFVCSRTKLTNENHTSTNSTHIIPDNPLTFEKDCHVHTCPREHIHRLPFSDSEFQSLVYEIIENDGDARKVFTRLVVPLSNALDSKGEPQTRLSCLTEAGINAFKRRNGLDTVVKQGVPDFNEMVHKLNKFKEQGATVAYKLPGVEPSLSSLDPEVHKYFTKNSCFVFIMTEAQARFVKAFGAVIATDGTHAVLSYTNVNLITVLVTSFNEEGTGEFKERGFPVVMALTTSECEEVHRAIVYYIRKAVGMDWTPKILMTDMAFGAFNAWLSFFKELIWLYCVFHVLQAWLKKLKNLKKPDVLKENEFSPLKGKLIKEIKYLICPDSKYDSLSKEDFTRRTALVSDLFWAHGFSNLAENWDTYVSRSNRWAPHARMEAIAKAFGRILLKIPMLIISNNPLENFFRHLKHNFLSGKSAFTFSMFLDIWDVHQTRIRIHSIKAGIDLRKLGIDNNLVVVNEEDEEDEVETEEEEDDDDEKEEEETVATPSLLLKHDNNLEEEEKVTTPRFLLRANVAPNLEQVRNRQLQDVSRNILNLQNNLSQLKVENLPDNASKILNAQMNQLNNLILTFNSSNHSSTVDASFLVGGSSKPFTKQAKNFGMATELVPTSSESGSANLELLFKKPRSKSKKKNVAEELQVDDKKINFEEYALQVLRDEALKMRINKAKLAASSEGFPALRNALYSNTVNRIKVFGLGLFNYTAPTTNAKDNIVTGTINCILERVSTEVIKEFAKSIADVAIVAQEDTEKNLKVNDIILLEVNSNDSMGQPSVEAREELSGWVIKDTKSVQKVNNIPISVIKWGNLKARKKDLKLDECLRNKVD